MEQLFFTATHRNPQVISKSSSGGMFTAISDEWFSAHGTKAVVCGCVLDEGLNAKHIRAVSPEERNRMRGSKYISSNATGIYKCVADDIKTGKFVLFSGTPCQIAALNSYLSAVSIQKSNQLLTVELICHGVGSNSFFADYIAYLESKYKSEAVSCSFRAKAKAGNKEDMQVDFKNGKKYNASSTNYDWFYSAYIKNLILRPSCYNCKFAARERNADITIGDNWNKGDNSLFLSLIIINSPKGLEIFKKFSSSIEFEKINFEDVHQPNLHHPTVKPDNYDEFWSIYRNNGFMSAQKYIGNNTLKGRLRLFAVDTVDKLNLKNSAKALKKAIRGK